MSYPHNSRQLQQPLPPAPQSLSQPLPAASAQQIVVVQHTQAGQPIPVTGGSPQSNVVYSASTAGGATTTIQAQVPLSNDVIQTLLQLGLPQSGEPVYVSIQSILPGASNPSMPPPPPQVTPPPPYSPGSSTTTAGGTLTPLSQSTTTAPTHQTALSSGPAPSTAPAGVGTSAQPQGGGAAANSTRSQKVQFDQSNIFISGLSWNLDDEGLKALFRPFGEMHSYRVLVEASTGRSKGVGFVHYKSRDSALAAIEQMNGSTPPDHTLPIKVKIAEEAAEFIPEVSNKLFVRNIPRSVVHGQFRGSFAQFGEVVHVSIMPDTSSQGRREQSGLNMGYVTFKTIDEATAATQGMHHRKDIFPGQDRLLEVKPAESLHVRNQRRNKDTLSSSAGTTSKTSPPLSSSSWTSAPPQSPGFSGTAGPSIVIPGVGAAPLLPQPSLLQEVPSQLTTSQQVTPPAPPVVVYSAANQQPQPQVATTGGATTIVGYQQQPPQQGLPAQTAPLPTPGGQQQQVIFLQPQMPPPPEH